MSGRPSIIASSSFTRNILDMWVPNRFNLLIFSVRGAAGHQILLMLFSTVTVGILLHALEAM